MAKDWKDELNWWSKKWMEQLEDSVSKEVLKKSKNISKKADVKFASGQLRGKVVYSSRPNAKTVFRVPKFDTKGRKALAQYIGDDPSMVARLMDGEFPKELYNSLVEREFDLIPSFTESLGDQDCDWWSGSWYGRQECSEKPCAHQGAIWHKAGMMIDKDPFFLLELLGVSRDSIMTASRVAKTAAMSRKGEGEILDDESIVQYWAPPKAIDDIAFDNFELGHIIPIAKVGPPNNGVKGRVFHMQLVDMVKSASEDIWRHRNGNSSH
jgi:uncharacterized Zn finger protein